VSVLDSPLRPSLAQEPEGLTRQDNGVVGESEKLNGRGERWYGMILPVKTHGATVVVARVRLKVFVGND
jgi:hypothetical protein